MPLLQQHHLETNLPKQDLCTPRPLWIMRDDLSDTTNDKLSIRQLRGMKEWTKQPVPTPNASQHIHVFSWGGQVMRQWVILALPMEWAMLPWKETEMLLGLTRALRPREDGLRGASRAVGSKGWLARLRWRLKVQTSLPSSLLTHLMGTALTVLAHKVPYPQVMVNSSAWAPLLTGQF